MKQKNKRKNSTISNEITTGLPQGRKMLNKVPEILIFFWIIKVLATTVGETAADFLNTNLNMGLTITTFVMSGFLIITLFFQFKSKKYVPGIYWLAVVLISVVGTLITDNLVDNLGVPLKTTTIIFSIALIMTFVIWYISEKTISIHSIYTTKREAFYWFTILFTFALGTAAGDLIAEGLSLGYWKSAVMFAVMIGIVAIAFYSLKLNAVIAFWIIYILTRPLGASLGDFLSQARSDGGLGLGTVGTSAIFLITILIIVVFLAITKKDQSQIVENANSQNTHESLKTKIRRDEDLLVD